MTFLRILAASWVVGSLLVTTWLVALGWRGEAPQLGDINAWLALAWALFLGAVFSAIPAALFSAAIWAAATKNARISSAAALTRRGRRLREVSGEQRELNNKFGK